MRDGKREGAGRKHSENKKIKVAFSLARDVVEYLGSIIDSSKAQVIEEVLKEHKKSR